MSSDSPRERIIQAFSAETFRQQGYQLIDRLTDYLGQVTDGKIIPVLPQLTPDEMNQQWSGAFSEKGDSEWLSLVDKIVGQSIHVHHPKYIGHQVTAPLPLAALFEFVSDFLNNSSAVYEMGPVNVIMEKKVIEWMAKMIGYDTRSSGVFTSGGTIGNLTALLAARQAKSGTDVWQKGTDRQEKLTVLVSAQSHYSAQRAVSVMGLGADSVILLPVNDRFEIDLNQLPPIFSQAQKEGRRVIALVANGCSTATGAYDPLEPLADFCQAHDIWLHVDGAHGASALLSPRYRDLLRGIGRADSVVWDAHKMLLMPALTTAVIYQSGARSYDAFAQQASYLFEKNSREEWYNPAHRTMECTKKMMGIKLYSCLKVMGVGFFRDYVEYVYDLTRDFAGKIRLTSDFELAATPQSNIICFRYIKKGQSESQLNQLQLNIREHIKLSERFYVVQTELNGRWYIRCTIMNPFTTLADLNELLEEIRRLANSRKF